MDQTIVKSMAVRLVVMVLIYALPQVNVWLKMLLILSTDAVKNVYTRYVHHPKPGDFATNTVYQRLDKILDTLGYWMCLSLLEQQKLLLPVERKALWVALVYRTIGAGYAVLTNNTKILLYFPDVFKEFLLVFWALQGRHATLAVFLCSVFLVLKVYVDYRFHVQKQGGDLIPPYVVVAVYGSIVSLRWLLPKNTKTELA